MGAPRSQTSVGWEVTRDRGENAASQPPLFSRSIVLSFCDPMDCARQTPLPDSQARILEWVAIPFSRRSSQLRIKLASPILADRFFTTEPPGKPPEGAVKTTLPIPTRVPLKSRIPQTQAPMVTPSLQSSEAVLHSCRWWGGEFAVVGF